MDLPPHIFTESKKEELQKGLEESEVYGDFSTDEFYTEFLSKPINVYTLTEVRHRVLREWETRQVITCLVGGASELGE